MGYLGSSQLLSNLICMFLRGLPDRFAQHTHSLFTIDTFVNYRMSHQEKLSDQLVYMAVKYCRYRPTQDIT